MDRIPSPEETACETTVHTLDSPLGMDWTSAAHMARDMQGLIPAIAVSTAGSFTEAAKLLGMSQPALSRRVQALERHMKVRLFERFGRGNKPTPTGQRLFETALPMLQTLIKIRAEALATDGTMRGTLHIGCPESMATTVMAKIIRMMEVHKHIRIHVACMQSDDLPGAVTDGRIHMGLSPYHRSMDHIVERHLWTERLVLVSRQMRASTSLASLRNQPFILPPVGSATRSVIDETLHQSGILLADITEQSHMEIIKSIVSEGHGHAFLPENMVRREIRQGTLHEISCPHGSMTRSICLLRDPRRTWWPMEHAFVTALESYQGGSGGNKP
jgi:DNA-binding transcriptional LysR family regulator